MAQKKQTPITNLTPEQIKKIWTKITVEEWLRLLQEFRPEGNWNLTKDSLKGLCVYHDENTPSCFVTPERGLVHCFGCHKTEWDPIHFFARVAKMPYADALRELSNRFRLSLPASFIKNAQLLEDHNQMKLVLLNVMNAELREAFLRPELPQFEYLHKAGTISWLRKRGFPGTEDRSSPSFNQDACVDGAVHLWPVGVFPPSERLYERLGEKEDWIQHREAAFNYLAKMYSQAIHTGSVMFFYFATPTRVGMLRCRHPSDEHLFYAVADEYDSSFGFFGLNMAAHLGGDLLNRRPLLMEGEMDALAIIAHQVATAVDDVLPMATGGGMQSDTSLLKEFGFESVSGLPDNDASGVGWGKRVLEHSSNINHMWSWNQEDCDAHIKDIDEAIRHYGFDKIRNRLTDKDSYLRPYEWLHDQLSIALQDIEKDDISQRTELAAKYGVCLRDDAERKAYVECVQTSFGLPQEIVLRNMLPAEDTWDGLVARITNKLFDEYYPLYTKQSGNNQTLNLWSKRRKEIRIINRTSTASSRAALELDLGQLGNYIRDELGEPEFLSYRKDGKTGALVPLSETAKDQNITLAFQHALAKYGQQIVSQSSLIDYGQGVHCLHDKSMVLIANGNKFYAGDMIGDKVNYTQLSCPVYKNYFMRASYPWSAELNSVEDLQPYASYDPRKTFQTILEILLTGWRFQHQELEARFLAGNIMYVPIAEAFKRMTLVSIQGNTQSGKSTLLQVMGDTRFPDLRLCEAGKMIEGYTEASLRQTMDRSSLWLLLDEFEDRDIGNTGNIGRNASTTRAVLSLFKSLATGATVGRGGVDGVPQEFLAYFPVASTGIHSLRLAEDINRFITIRMKNISGFGNPADLIRKKFSGSQIAKVRRDVTLGLLSQIPRIMQTYAEVCKEFEDNSSLSAKVENRLRENLMPAAAIMKFAGEDYVKFLSEFGGIKAQEMHEVGAFVPDSEKIWNQMLNTAIPLPRTDSTTATNASVARILTQTGLSPHILEDLDVGLFYLPARKWLLVFWEKAVSGVLRYSNLYKGTQYAGRLKQTADTDPRVIPVDTLKRMSFLSSEVWPRTGSKITYEDISVLNVRDTLVTATAVTDYEKRAEDERSKLMLDSADPTRQEDII